MIQASTKDQPILLSQHQKRCCETRCRSAPLPVQAASAKTAFALPANIFQPVRGKIHTAALNECFFLCQGQKSRFFFRGMIIPHSIGNPYFRYIKPTTVLGFLSIPYGNNWSLHPITYEDGVTSSRYFHHFTLKS